MTARSGTSFRLSWTEVDPPPTVVASAGTIDFQHTDTGLVNTNYQSTQPPPQLPDPVRERVGLRELARRPPGTW